MQAGIAPPQPMAPAPPVVPPVQPQTPPMPPPPQGKPKKSKPIQFSAKKVAELKKDIDQKFDDWKQQRRIRDAQVILNLAYYVGSQYLYFDAFNSKLMPVDIPVQDQTLAVFNRIQPKCRYALARMTNQLPCGQAIPNSNNSEDVQAAEIGTDWLKHSYRTNKIPKVHREAALWTIIGGNAWEKVVWDSQAGELYADFEQEPDVEPGVDPVTQMPLLDDQQQPVMQPKLDPVTQMPMMKDKLGKNGQPVISNTWNEGKVRRTVVGPLNMYYEMSIQDWDDVDECIERQSKSVEWVKKHIPNCEDVVADVPENIDNAYAMMYNSNVASSANTLKNSVAVKEYWLKRCDDYPQGAHVIIVNHEVRVAEPMDVFSGFELPYSISGYINVPGQIWCIGLPEPLISPQQTYNKTMSQVIDNANDMINIKILEHETTRIVDPITDQSGERVKYSGEKPEFWQPLPLPQTHFQILAKIEDNFDVISMIHRVAEGQVDASINSGDQVDAITENDKMGANPIIDSFGEMIAHAAHLELEIVQDKVVDEVLIRISGEDGKYKMKPFRGADLKNNTDVALIPGSMSQESPAAQRRKIEMMLQNNVLAQLPPLKAQAFLEEMLKLMNLGNSAKFIQEINSSADRATNENQGFFAGVPAYVLPWDDNDIHIEVVERLLNSPEFENWDKPNKDLAVSHWNAHVQKRNEIAQQQAQGGMTTPPLGQGPAVMAGGGGPQGAPPMTGKPEPIPSPKQEMAASVH